LQLSLFALSLVTGYTGNAMIADPPPAQKTAPLSDADRKKLLAERDRFFEESEKLQSQGKFIEAIAAAEKMLAIERKVLGDVNEDVAGSLDRLAELHEAREEFATARQLRQNALATRTKLYGEKDWRVTNSRLALEQSIRLSQLDGAQRRDLAKATSLTQEVDRLKQKRQFGKAAKLAENVLTIRKKVLGEAHPHYALSLNSLANLYYSQGAYAQAEPLFRQALAIQKKVLGEAHPDYAASLSNLAFLYYSQRAYAKAEPLFRQMSEIYKKALGEAHPYYATALSHLAESYRSQGEYAKAEPFFRQALAIRKKALGETHPDYALSLNLLANLYYYQADYSKAEPLLRQALAIRKKVLGEAHPDYARNLNDLAALYCSQEAYAKAEPLFRQALAIRKKALGEAHPHYAASLNSLALLYYSQGAYSKAEPLLRQALAIRKQVLGEAHPDYAASLGNLAHAYRSQGEYAKAEPLFRQASEIYKTVSGEAHPDYATSLNSLAMLYYYQGAYSKAEPLFRQALAIRKKALGEAHPDYATSLQNLARLCDAQGDYGKSEPLYRQALAIQKKVLGEAHRDYAASLNNLANSYRSQGDYAKAEPLARQAMAIRKKVLGEMHADYAVSLVTLASLYDTQGDYAKAEPLFRQALEINKSALGESHRDYAASLLGLAELYRRQGDYAKAEPLLRQASEIFKKALGESHRDYAASLLGLAELYLCQGDYAKAEPLLRQASEIFKKALGEAHPHYAASLLTLASLYHSQGEYAKAEPLLRQASEIFKKALGAAHPDYAQSLNNLAVVYRYMGAYAQAEPLFRLSLAIKKNALGEAHPDYALSLNNLALLYYYQGDYAKAEPLSRQALEIFEKHFANTLRIQSERQQLAMAKLLRSNLDYYLTITAGEAASAAEVYRHLLGWKGAVFWAQSMARRARANPELEPLFDELLSVSTHLATLSLAIPDPKRREVWLRQIGDLTNRKEDLERDLATKSAEFRQAQESISLTPDQLQHVLPAGTALVDVLEYTSSSPSPERKGPDKHEQRLVAFVVRSDHPIVRVDLGSVQPLVEAAERWRRSILGAEKQSIASPARPLIDSKSMKAPEGLLRERLWNPLLPHLQGVDLVMISPDGFLNQIPLAALPGREPGTYLVEETQLVTVPVPRELPALLKTSGTNASSSNPSLLVVGNVDFGGDPGLVSIAQRDVALVGTQHRAAVRGSGGLVFDPLPGTAAEIEDVEQLFRARFPGKEIKALQKSAATEDTFRAEAPRHRWIHLATHGFFAPESVRSGLDRSTDDEQRLHGELFGTVNEVRGFHPGLLSGIALAGANGGSHSDGGLNSIPGREADDGVLTALEVTGLDLRNVDLVVLSACETGLGRVAGGEGVLGLQRAFQLAGAKNVVASLWKVDDRATVALMRVFYHKLWVEQKPAAVALREAQLAMLRHPEQIELLATTRGANFDKTVKLVDHGQHTSTLQSVSPRLWAAFVVSGTGR
jgi:tetratricopeptide (TPR) repeat protein/CHAT domain-containing protein